MGKLILCKRYYRGEVFVVNKRLGVHRSIYQEDSDRKRKIAGNLRAWINGLKPYKLYSDDKFYFRIKRKREYRYEWEMDE